MTQAPPVLPPYPPEDFDEFWEGVLASRARRPPAYIREHDPEDDISGHRIERIDFKGDAGGLLHGWIAIPDAVRLPAPAFLWLPAYGNESHPPDEYSCYPGFVSMSFNLHGLPAFHEEPYVPEKGYLARGLEGPDTWVYRTVVLDALRGLDILAVQPEVDPDSLFCAGLSQGGGLAIMLAALSDRLRGACGDLPFLAAMPWTIRKAAYRYPYKEMKDFADARALGMETVLSTLSYYDTVNMATRAKCPVQVSYGTKDPACPPNTVQAVYDALPEPKRLVVYEGLGHDWHPEMPANNVDWLQSLLV